MIADQKWGSIVGKKRKDPGGTKKEEVNREKNQKKVQERER